MQPINTDYIKSPNGIIRIVEAVLCLATFIMSAVLGSGGWLSYIQFATLSGFLHALAYFFKNLFMSNTPNYRPHLALQESIMSAVWIVFLLIAAIISAVKAAQCKDPIKNHTYILLAVTTAFSFFCTIAYAMGCFFLFKHWRSQSVTSTTTTSPS